MLAIAGLAAIAVVGGALLMSLTPAAVTFAQAPAPTAQPSPGAPAQNGLNNYQNFFLNALAGRLGVAVDQLKQALIGAFNDTIDQLVNDGILTQARADQIKSAFSNRVNQGTSPGVIAPFGFGRFGDFGRFGFGRGFLMGRLGVGLPSFAKALNMNVQDLISQLQSGKTIADVAKEKNVDLAQVKTSVLNDLKAMLDQAVQNGNLTQTRADAIYNQVSSNFDTLVNRSWNRTKQPVPPGTTYE
jgi:hypothetical protein